MALELITASVYCAAAAAQLAGRPLTYVVTAKGSAAGSDTVRTFRPHLGWAALAVACLISGRVLHHDYPSLYFWAGLTLVICLAPVLHLFAPRLTAVPARVAVSLPRGYPVATRRRIGQVLLQQGLLTAEQLDHLLDLQATSDAPWQRLGDLAVHQGYITAQLGAALRNEARPHDRIPSPREEPTLPTGS